MALNRLRRTPIGRTEDPLRHASGLPTTGTTLDTFIHPSPQGEVEISATGEVVVAAHPGAGSGSVSRRYHDTAEQAKPNRPSAHPDGLPFTLR